MRNRKVVPGVAMRLAIGISKGIRVLSITAFVMSILYQNDALATKPLPQWPLDCELVPQVQEIVGAPILYQLTVRPSMLNNPGPIERIDITLSLMRGLVYTGPLKWSVDFKNQDEITIPLEVMINRNDTAGFVLDLRVHLGSGHILFQPFQRFFLSADSPLYRTVNYEPPQLTPELWIEGYGTVEQRDSARAVRWKWEAEEYARKKALEPDEIHLEVATFYEGSDAERNESGRAHHILKELKDEANPMSGRPHEFYEIGGVFLCRLYGESKYRLWKPYSLSEQYDLVKKNIRPTYIDRTLDSVTIYLAIVDNSSLEEARSIVPDLVSTEMDAIFKATVAADQFKEIVNGRFKFETKISDFESRPAIVPFDSTQGSVGP